MKITPSLKWMSCTELAVDIDIPSTYQAYFKDVWPRGLKAVKKLAEK